MSLKEFAEARKKAQHFGFFESSKVNRDNPKETLIENFAKGELFDHAFYDFEKFSLARVLLFTERIDPKYKDRDTFVKEILNLYGSPDEIVVVQQDDGKYNSPGLIWRRGDILIMADFTLDAPKAQPIYYEFKAFNTNTSKPMPFYAVPALPESKEAKIIADAKALIARLKNEK